MNIMLTLKNIKKENRKFLCDAFVEDASTPMKLAYNIDTDEMDDYIPPKGYGHCKTYVSMASMYFENVISGKEKLRNEKLIMWY